jgi:hypothetical protein
MELKNSECVEWKYVNYMKNIFQSIGLDHYYYGNFNTNIFKHFFGNAVRAYIHNESPNEIRLKLPCSPKIHVI